MIVLRRTGSRFGNIHGAPLLPARFVGRPMGEIAAETLLTDSGTKRLDEIFEVYVSDPLVNQREHDPLVSASPIPDVVLVGDCSQIHEIGFGMKQGALCVLGSVGDSAGKSMQGGSLIVARDAANMVASGMRDGFVFVGGSCGHHLACPLPGKSTGMRGGDVIVSGNTATRACERMRRGTVLVGGSAGDYAASQLIAGTLIVLGDLGQQWAGGMRRGSIILGRDFTSRATALLSEAREFELSFLPLVWRHLEKLHSQAHSIIDLAISTLQSIDPAFSFPVPKAVRIPRTRWVQRQVADLNCRGRGEVLVLRRTSSSTVRP